MVVVMTVERKFWRICRRYLVAQPVDGGPDVPKVKTGDPEIPDTRIPDDPDTDFPDRIQMCGVLSYGRGVDGFDRKNLLSLHECMRHAIRGHHTLLTDGTILHRDIKIDNHSSRGTAAWGDR